MAASASGDVRDIPQDVQFAPHPTPDGPHSFNYGPCHQCVRDNKPCDFKEPQCTACKSSWRQCIYDSPSRVIEDPAAASRTIADSAASSPLSSPMSNPRGQPIESPIASSVGSSPTSHGAPVITTATQIPPKPAATKRVAPKIAAPKPATTKPAVPKPAASKPAVSKPAAPQPVTKGAKPASSPFPRNGIHNLINLLSCRPHPTV